MRRGLNFDTLFSDERPGFRTADALEGEVSIGGRGNQGARGTRSRAPCKRDPDACKAGIDGAARQVAGAQ